MDRSVDRSREKQRGLTRIGQKMSKAWEYPTGRADRSDRSSEVHWRSSTGRTDWSEINTTPPVWGVPGQTGRDSIRPVGGCLKCPPRAVFMGFC